MAYTLTTMRVCCCPLREWHAVDVTAVIMKALGAHQVDLVHSLVDHWVANGSVDVARLEGMEVEADDLFDALDRHGFLANCYPEAPLLRVKPRLNAGKANCRPQAELEQLMEDVLRQVHLVGVPRNGLEGTVTRELQRAISGVPELAELHMALLSHGCVLCRASFGGRGANASLF